MSDEVEWRRQISGIGEGSFHASQTRPEGHRRAADRGWPFRPGCAGGAASALSGSPGIPGWPSEEQWEGLGRGLQGELIKVQSPLTQCVGAQADACTALFKEFKNPYFLGDEVGLTQSLGWVDAWTSRPSVYAVAAQSTADVAAAVNFARDEQPAPGREGRRPQLSGNIERAGFAADLDAPHGRHRAARRIRPAGCEGKATPQPAVSIGAGAIWVPRL